MFDPYGFFNGVVTTTVVRNGADVILTTTKGGEKYSVNFRPVVYREMLIQIMRDYPALPDYRTLTMTEIKFFYDGLRAELKAQTKGK